MSRTPVTSSTIHSIGYDPKRQRLEIQFHHGGIYRYHHVPPPIHESLMNAPSKGSFFHTHIRDHHNYDQLEP